MHRTPISAGNNAKVGEEELAILHHNYESEEFITRLNQYIARSREKSDEKPLIRHFSPGSFVDIFRRGHSKEVWSGIVLVASVFFAHRRDKRMEQKGFL